MSGDRRGGGLLAGLAFAIGINAVIIGFGWAVLEGWRALGLHRILGESPAFFLMLIGAGLVSFAVVAVLGRGAPAAPPAPPPIAPAHWPIAPPAVAQGALDALFAARAFTFDDLEQNRRGLLSSRQRRSFTRGVIAWFVGAGALAAWDLRLLTADVIRSKNGSIVPMGERIFGAGIYALIGLVFVWMATSRIRALRRAEVSVTCGMIRVAIETGSRGARFEKLYVGERKLGITRELHDAVVVSIPWRVYHYDETDEVLSMEPLR